VKVLVAPESQADEVVIGDDLAALIARAPTNPALAEMLADDLGPFLLAAQTALGPDEDGELRNAAAASDWSSVLHTATLALRSRLTSEA
jgi:exonuclease SbcD